VGDEVVIFTIMAILIRNDIYNEQAITSTLYKLTKIIVGYPCTYATFIPQERGRPDGPAVSLDTLLNRNIKISLLGHPATAK
jgi:hypothetical protein